MSFLSQVTFVDSRVPPAAVIPPRSIAWQLQWLHAPEALLLTTAVPWDAAAGPGAAVPWPQTSGLTSLRLAASKIAPSGAAGLAPVLPQLRVLELHRCAPLCLLSPPRKFHTRV